MRISDKALSGRYVLTITGGLCLLAFTACDCACALLGRPVAVDPMAILGVVGTVVAFYFAKPPDGNPPANPPHTGATA